MRDLIDKPTWSQWEGNGGRRKVESLIKVMSSLKKEKGELVVLISQEQVI